MIDRKCRLLAFGGFAAATALTLLGGAIPASAGPPVLVYETTIDSLRRFKEDVREVAEGFECGIHLESYDDVKEGDVIEAYEVRQVERTALDETPAPAAS